MIIYDKDKYVKNPIASIRILAYNQESSISNAIDSVINQRCNFEYEIIIGEDCSTDNTRAICIEYQLKYPEKIKLILNEHNLGIVNNYRNVNKEAKGKYIACCAGDDNWCDEYKLQEQVNVMEENESIGLVYTDYIINSINTGEKYIKLTASPQDNIFTQLLIGNFISASTVCYRSSLLEYLDFDLFINKGFKMEDYPIWLEFSQFTRFCRIPKVTVSYQIERVNKDNTREIALHACHFDEYSTNIRLYYIEKYTNKTNLSRKDILNAHYTLCYKQGLNINDREFALKYLKMLSYQNLYIHILRVICKYNFLFYLYQRYRSLKHRRRTNLQIYFGQ